MVASILTTAVLLVLGVVYYFGSSGRIASDYTVIASPANAALSPARAAYTRDSAGDLGAARTDLFREEHAVRLFATTLDTVSFPAGEASTAREALVNDGEQLAKLIGQQAAAPTLPKMRALGSAAGAEAATAETQARDLRRALGLPPASGDMVF